MKAKNDGKGSCDGKVKLLIPILSACIMLLLALLLPEGKEYSREAGVVVSTITPPAEVITLSAPPPTSIPVAVKLSRPMPNLFYSIDQWVCHAAGEEFKPRKIVRIPENTEDAFFIRSNAAGNTIIYPQITTNSAGQVSSELFCSDLTAGNPEGHSLGTGIRQSAINRDGDRVAYLEKDVLYIDDFNQAKKLAEGVGEFYMDPTGDRFVYITTDSRLFLLEVDLPAREIDYPARLEVVSNDLNTILYINQGALFLAEDGKAPRRIDSEVRSLFTGSVCADGSFYYIKDRAQMPADFVLDDMASADAVLGQPIRSDFPDAAEFAEALRQFEEKSNRDAIRQSLADSQDIIRTEYSLYFYSTSSCTQISSGIFRIWAYPNGEKQSALKSLGDRAFVAYSRVKPEKVKLSEFRSCADLTARIRSLFPMEEHYVCSPTGSPEKFHTGTIHELHYDMKNSALAYMVNYRAEKDLGDLHGVTVRDGKICENRLYARDIHYDEPGDLLVDDGIVYLTGGNNLAEDYWLFVNHEKLDSGVLRIYPIKNSRAFLYVKYGDVFGYALYLCQDGRTTEISREATSFCALDESHVVYIITAVDGNTQNVYLFDGTATYKLFDTSGFSDFAYINFVEPSQ